MQKIYIAMHKPYAVPKDALYVPLQVGAEGKKPFALLGITRERISRRKIPAIAN